MRSACRIAAAAVCMIFNAASPAADSPAPAYGGELQGFAYPYPVKRYEFSSQRQPLQMAYMDVAPAQPNGHVAVLLESQNDRFTLTVVDDGPGVLPSELPPLDCFASLCRRCSSLSSG